MIHVKKKHKTSVGWGRCNSKHESVRIQWADFYDSRNKIPLMTLPFRQGEKGKDPWSMINGETHEFYGEKAPGSDFCELCGYTGLKHLFVIEPLAGCPEHVDRRLEVGSCCVTWLEKKEINRIILDRVKEDQKIHRDNVLELLTAKSRITFGYLESLGEKPKELLRLFDWFDEYNIIFRADCFSVNMRNQSSLEYVYNLGYNDTRRLPLNISQSKRLEKFAEELKVKVEPIPLESIPSEGITPSEYWQFLKSLWKYNGSTMTQFCDSIGTVIWLTRNRIGKITILGQRPSRETQLIKHVSTMEEAIYPLGKWIAQQERSRSEEWSINRYSEREQEFSIQMARIGNGKFGKFARKGSYFEWKNLGVSNAMPHSPLQLTEFAKMLDK